MNRRVRDATVGAGYLVVLAALLVLSVLVYTHTFTSYVDVALRTDHVGSALQKGSDVKVRGVLVGQVDDVTTDGTGAIVHLQLDPGQAEHLPANMTAQLLPKTTFGERYVALVFPQQPSRARLASGDTIKQDRSARSVELEQLFQDLLPALQAVEPQKLVVVLTELATGLRGRGTDLADLAGTLTHYLGALNPQVPRISDDLEKLAAVARTYGDAAPDLVSSLDSLTVTSRSVVRYQQQVIGLLRSLTSLSNSGASLIGDNEQAIIGLSRDSLPTLRVLRRYSPEFACLSRTLAAYIPKANKAFGAGTDRPGAHVVLHIVPKVGPYTAADRPVSSTADPGPRCPGASAGALTSPAPDPAAESTLINDLVAPGLGVRPSALPGWSSLVLGPALRGTQVTVK